MYVWLSLDGTRRDRKGDIYSWCLCSWWALAQQLYSELRTPRGTREKGNTVCVCRRNSVLSVCYDDVAIVVDFVVTSSAAVIVSRKSVSTANKVNSIRRLIHWQESETALRICHCRTAYLQIAMEMTMWDFYYPTPNTVSLPTKHIIPKEWTDCQETETKWAKQHLRWKTSPTLVSLAAIVPDVLSTSSVMAPASLGT